MTDVLEAVSSATAQSQALLDRTAHVAKQTLDRRRQAQRNSVIARRSQLRVSNARMSQALAGIKALTVFRESTQAQELLSLRGSIVLFARNAAFADSSLYLTADRLCLEDVHYGIQWGHNESIVGRSGEDPFLTARLYFGSTDYLLNSRKLKPILRDNDLDLSPQEADEDWDDYLYRKRIVDDAFDTDIMFQILVDCSNPEKFERYILPALG